MSFCEFFKKVNWRNLILGLVVLMHVYGGWFFWLPQNVPGFIVTTMYFLLPGFASVVVLESFFEKNGKKLFISTLIWLAIIAFAVLLFKQDGFLFFMRNPKEF